MKAWEIEEIRRGVKGKWLMRGDVAAGGRRFNGRVCTDSRVAGEGDLFVAIAGKTHDAHAFLKEVMERDVAAVVVHRELPAELLSLAQTRNVAVVLVDETVAALNRLAAAYRETLRAKVIAVGGSNGKTTCKRIIHALLAERFGAAGGHASPKSFNNNIGMPLTLLEVETSHEFVVLEIGTNAPGEIAALGEVCRPDIAVITSVGLEHLELLGDLEGVAREAAASAPFGAAGGTLVLPADAPELLAAVKVKAQRILVGHADTVGGANAQIDFVLTEVVESVNGTAFSINGRGAFRVPLLGEHNAMNALMAIAVARRMGLSDEQIGAGLAKVMPAEGRLEPMQIGTWAIIHDAYNANPSSMEAALKTFARLKVAAAEKGKGKTGRKGTKKRKVVILADMLELGVTSEAMHRSIGGMVAAWEFDLFIAIGPGMKFAADVAEAAGVEVVRFKDTAAAARSGLADLLKPGDNLLLKGSHGMALETLLTHLKKAIPARVA